MNEEIIDIVRPELELMPKAGSALDIHALLEFSRLLNESDDVAFIYNNILLALMGKLGLGRAAIALAAGSGEFSVTYSKGALGGLVGFSFPWNAGTPIGMQSLSVIPDGTAQNVLSSEKIRQIMPVTFAGETFALVLLGSPLHPGSFEAGESNYALLVAAIAAMAIEGCRVRGSLVSVNRKLERRVHRLRSLFEAGRAFNTLHDSGDILRLLGYTLMGEMAISRFAVALRVGEAYHIVVNRFAKDLPAVALNQIAHEETLILSPVALAGSDAHSILYELGVRASIPMDIQGESYGVLLVGKRLQQSIDEEDAEYLASLANLAVTSLENARLLEEMIEKKRMEEDLRIAWEIQQGLLPKSLPTLQGFELAAQTIPSQQVGGDCYDVIDLGDGRVLLSVADVSGKGTPASLLMANVQAALRALAPLQLPLPDLISRINDVIYQNTSYDKFITAFIGIIDTRTGELRYVNAGHNPPYLFCGKEIESLDKGGLILGVMPSLLPYEEGRVMMSEGDLLILYTDGVNEAMNTLHEEYGDERFQKLFRDQHTLTAQEALERTHADIREFTHGASQSDDITLVVLKRC